MKSSHKTNTLTSVQKAKYVKQLAILSLLIGAGAGLMTLLSTATGHPILVIGSLFQITFFLVIGGLLLRTTNLARARYLLTIFIVGVMADAVIQVTLQGAQHLIFILASHVFLALIALITREFIRPIAS